jgi:hypothetical protein
MGGEEDGGTEETEPGGGATFEKGEAKYGMNLMRLRAINGALIYFGILGMSGGTKYFALYLF